MNLVTWQKSRLVILICCNFTILVALVLLLTKSDNNILKQNKTLAAWQLVETNNLLSDHRNIEGRKYQDQSNHNLVIEIYHITNNNAGNSQIISQYLELDSDLSNINIKQDKNIGHFGIFAANNKMHLTTCIHSEGQLAFTKQQFGQLANYNIKSRLFPWILGFKDLRDWTCLWVNMSMSLENLSEEQAALLLQEQLFNLVEQFKLN